MRPDSADPPEGRFSADQALRDLQGIENQRGAVGNLRSPQARFGHGFGTRDAMKFLRRFLFPHFVWKVGCLLAMLLGVHLSINFYPVTDPAKQKSGMAKAQVVYEDWSIPGKRPQKIHKLYLDFGSGPERASFPLLLNSTPITIVDGKTVDVRWVERRESIFSRETLGRRVLSLRLEGKELVDEQVALSGYYDSFYGMVQFTLVWFAGYLGLVIFGGRVSPQLLSQGVKS